MGAQPLPRVLELAAFKAADSIAFDYLGISERMTLMAGGALFILFAIAALIQGPASY